MHNICSAAIPIEEGHCRCSSKELSIGGTRPLSVSFRLSASLEKPLVSGYFRLRHCTVDVFIQISTNQPLPGILNAGSHLWTLILRFVHSCVCLHVQTMHICVRRHIWTFVAEADKIWAAKLPLWPRLERCQLAWQASRWRVVQTGWYSKALKCYEMFKHSEVPHCLTPFNNVWK